ncbi:MAG: hypothetical protein ACYTGH_03160, partial [Planctomycetota bacterium]
GYISRYADRVQNVRNAIRFELLMKTTLQLCERAVERTDEGVSMEELRAQSEERAVRRLRELYGNDLPPEAGDEEFIDLYRHDYDKLVTMGLIDALIESLHP